MRVAPVRRSCRWVVAIALASCAAPPAKAPAPTIIALEGPAAPARAAPAVPTGEYVELLATIEATYGDPATTALRRKEAFGQLRKLADPRAADALVAFLATTPPPAPRWRTQAALALGELGDLRAASPLAWRLGQDPRSLYGEEDPALTQDDSERIVAAELLAELAVIHPDRIADLRSAAEGPMLAWANDKPQPHANALRFFALARSPQGIARLRALADPTSPLPSAKDHELSPEWAVAGTALRWLGAASKDKATFELLNKQLGRRPAPMDCTNEGLVTSGAVMLGMALESLAVGAAQGLSQQGDANAFFRLAAYIEDRKESVRARVEAAHALGWTATDVQLRGLVDKVKDPTPSRDMKRELVRSLVLSALAERAAPGSDAALLPLLASKAGLEVRHSAARVIGSNGVDADVTARLVALLDDPASRVDAALALLLGAHDAALATRAIAKLEPVQTELEVLETAYAQTFGAVTVLAYEDGSLARWVSLASTSPWATSIIGRALAAIEHETGPHTLSRVQLRARLYGDARSTDATKKRDALLVLEAMQERGVLAAIGATPSR